MKFIKFVLQKFIGKELPKPLGRWKIEECNNKVINKVDLSNEDHCGPCGKYALDKMNSINKKRTDEMDSIKMNKLDDTVSQ
jgi:hypothetical protein